MKVYWLKDIKTKEIVGYDKLHYLEDFCSKHNGNRHQNPTIQ